MLLCCVVATAASSAAAAAATSAAAAPVSYWRFEDAGSPGADSATTGGVALQPKAAASWAPKAFADGGIVGGYVEIANTSLAAAGGPFPRSATAAGVTVEFLFRTGRDFQRYGNSTLFAATPAAGAAGGGWIEGGLLRHSLVWRADASLTPDQGECQSEQDRVLPGSVPCSRLEVPLDQAGRRTMFYLDDGAWHHIAFRKDAATGEQSIWLDGEAPDGFVSPFAANATGSAIPQPHTGGTPAPFQLLPTQFDGAIDEVALWDEALPDALIARHYKDAMAHKPYSMTVRNTPPCPPCPPCPQAGIAES